MSGQSPTPVDSSTRFSKEIQALRAVAVLSVVAFHLWPKNFQGGFVGVDVFFVISGFLITGHLLREGESTGTIRLRAFWARRIRRLLPAAFLVLIACIVVIIVILPTRVWQDTATQIGASAVGAQNWLLAINSVDYFGAQNQPTLVQHYWSLSLEEQFYVFWPLLLVAVFWFTRKLSPSTRRRVVGVAISVVFVASFFWSVYESHVSPSAAYFSTFTHGWEFAVGGILALFYPALTASRWDSMTRTRALATWVGLAAIILSGVFFTGRLEFPGWIALIPVVGTATVIAAGSSSSWIQRVLFLRSRPFQFIGGISYSIYLWHWPIIVALPFATGHPPGIGDQIAALVLSIVLAWLTKLFVEDRVRRSRAMNYRLWATYSIAVGAAIVVIIGSSSVVAAAVSTEGTAQAAARKLATQALDGGNPCFGAAAMNDPENCPLSHTPVAAFGPDFASEDWGTIAGVMKDGTLGPDVPCIDFSPDRSGYLDCTLGNRNGSRTLAIVGDSHALALIDPLVNIATQQGWRVRTFLMNSCSPSTPMVYSDTATGADCNRWRDLVIKRVAADSSIDMVVTTGFTREEPDPTYVGTKKTLEKGYASVWSTWAAAGKRVYVIEDVPLTAGGSVPDCVATHIKDKDPCSEPRSFAVGYDPLVNSVSLAASPRVTLINLTPQFCDSSTCYEVIGGLIVYRDSHHLTGTFALTLIPALERGFGLTK